MQYIYMQNTNETHPSLVFTVLVRSLCSKCNQSADVLAGCHRRQPYSNASFISAVSFAPSTPFCYVPAPLWACFFLVFMKEVI